MSTDKTLHFVGDTKVQYSVTEGGNFCKFISKSGNIVAFHATPRPENFLDWILQDAKREVQCLVLRKKLMDIIAPWWNLKDPICHRGHFNRELYLKIIEAKKENGTLNF